MLGITNMLLGIANICLLGMVIGDRAARRPTWPRHHRGRQRAPSNSRRPRDQQRLDHQQKRVAPDPNRVFPSLAQHKSAASSQLRDATTSNTRSTAAANECAADKPHDTAAAVDAAELCTNTAGSESGVGLAGHSGRRKSVGS